MRTATDEQERRAIAWFLSSKSEESFCALFDAFYRRLYCYFTARGISGDDGEELAQDVMFLVYRHAAQLREVHAFHAWLFQIAHNEYLQYVRRKASRPATVEYEPLASYLAETLSRDEELADAPLQEWLGGLEHVEREILLLRFVDDLGYPEISQILGIPVGTVKWRAFTAKEKLGTLMGKTLKRRA